MRMITELQTYSRAYQKFIAACTEVIECNILLQSIDETIVKRFKHVIPDHQLSQEISQLHSLITYRITSITNRSHGSAIVKEN